MDTTPRRPFVVVAFVAALGAACSAPSGASSSAPSDDPSSAAARKNAHGAAACVGVSGACDPGQAPPAGSRCVTTVDTTVTDPDGQPLAGMTAMTCSEEICVAGRSDAAGHVHLAACHLMTGAALKFVGGAKWVTTAIPLPAGDGEGAVRADPLTVVTLPDSGPAFPEPGQSATLESAGTSLTVTAENRVRLPTLLTEPDQKAFRAAAMPDAWTRANVDPTIGAELAVGLGPEGTKFEAPAALSIPNSRGWPAGAAVDLFVVGLDPGGDPAEGAWKSVGGGHVTDDGIHVVTDPGGGISTLTMVAARLRR
jgi:hypothetical protein